MPTSKKHHHAVQFYSDESSLARTVARFMAEGRRSGQPGVVIATPKHTHSIVRELTACGMNVEELREHGELQLLDARKLLSSFMLGPNPDPVMFKTQVGGVIEKLSEGRQPGPVRAYGEMVDLLWQDGNADGAIKLEMLWNGLASSYDFSLMCGYAVGHFYKETRDPRYQDVCDQHSHVSAANDEASPS